jgi:hypothetical protein
MKYALESPAKFRLEQKLKIEKNAIFRCNVRARDCKFDLPDSGGLLSLPRRCFNIHHMSQKYWCGFILERWKRVWRLKTQDLAG